MYASTAKESRALHVGHTLRGSAKEVGLRQIVSLIDVGDMDAAEKEAEVWLDRW